MQLRGSIVCVCAVLASCGREGVDTVADITITETVPFTHVFDIVDSVTFEQPDTAVIVRVSGVDRDPVGNWLIGDASESNVKVFTSAGVLKRIIGRGGKGPGEFGQPRFPRFGPDGRFHVADAEHSLVSVFDPEGRYERAVGMTQFSPIMSFHLLPNGDYFVSATFASDSVLYRIDSTGAVGRTFLNKQRLRATLEPDSRVWGPVTQYWADLVADTAYVVSTISDSIWAVDLRNGVTTARRLVFPGYVQPVPPAERPRGIKALQAWSSSFHIAAALRADHSGLLIPFVQGVLNYGDPMILVVRTPRGEWKALSGAPPIVYAGRGVVAGLLTPNQPEVVLGLYRWKDM